MRKTRVKMLKRLADYVSEVMVARDPKEVVNGVRRRRHFRRNWNRTPRPMRRKLLGTWAQEGTMAAAFGHDGHTPVSANTLISNEAHFGLPVDSRMIRKPEVRKIKKSALDGPVGSIRTVHKPATPGKSNALAVATLAAVAASGTHR